MLAVGSSSRATLSIMASKFALAREKPPSALPVKVKTKEASPATWGAEAIAARANGASGTSRWVNLSGGREASTHARAGSRG
jgi:hypothetical protein